VGWGVFGIAMSTTLACSVLTSLDGLTGGNADDAGASPPRGANDAAGSGGNDAALATGSDDADPDSRNGGDDAASPADASATPPTDSGAPSDAPADTAILCTDGGIACGGRCIDPASDPSNCNGCGNVCATGLCGTSLSAPMSSLPAGWSFNGSASYNTFAPSAELTKASEFDQAGTFLYENPIVLDALNAKFEFRIGLQGGSRCDGMGFVIEQSGPTAVGAFGGGLGMAGLTGFGVELDIFNNAYCSDTSNNHVGIDDLSICPDQAGMPTSLFETDVSSVLDLGDADWHSAEITVASGAISLSIDDRPLMSGVALTGVSTAPYYLGFAGATGGLLADDGGPGGYRQEVKDVVITFPTPRCL
jgi:hypothetical protein